MPDFYTWAILLINQSDEIEEKQLSIFGSIGVQNIPLMHVPPKTFIYGFLIKKKDTYFFFKFGVSPFVELCPFQRVIMIFCKQNISKTITAMSFKLVQLIEGNE